MVVTQRHQQSPQKELEDLLVYLGFVENEIDDFVEYWIPRLGDAKYYAVYPQDAESFVTLYIDPVPENILRALLLILPLTNKISISPPPAPAKFNRNGFSVAEWGVIWLGN